MLRCWHDPWVWRFSQVGLTGLNIESYSWRRFTIQKKNQHREKSRGSRNTEDEAQVYQSSFPVASHRIRLIPPASNCCKPCEASWRLHTQGFCWRRVTQRPSTWHVPKRQTPERKAGVGIHHIICTNSLGIVHHAIG